ncbi:MAG TPA: glutamate--cysteine ligase [Sphingomonadales bacterium]|nr:glutamate--cysteine ligase [Sphingomonadales bacterium]
MSKTRVIESKAELVESLQSGSKPKGEWRIGTEHEKFAFDLKTLKPVPYEGRRSIRAILQAFTRFGWEGVFEKDNLIALKKGGASITLEPAGQFELSGEKLETIHQTCDEVRGHLRQAKEVGAEFGAGFLGLGFHPTITRAEAPLMPKGRYAIMRAYMPTKGGHGLDMMLRTATVQTNLDFSDEADMVKKFRVGLALQPVATALFANSPFTEGKPNGFKSYRSFVWTDTDPDRTGAPAFVFDKGFGFERYVDFALDVPMYFVYRDGYINAAGQSFRDFLKGRLPALPGEKPTLSDWADHLTTIFTEVRLKTFLEMRGADGGVWARLCALPAFWVGLLYEQEALDAASDLVRGWSQADMAAMRASVPKMGLAAPWGKGTLRELAAEVLSIADFSLKKRNRLSRSGETEQGFLDVLHAEIERNATPADELLRLYHGPWKGRIEPVFKEAVY